MKLDIARSLELDFTDRINWLIKDCDNLLWLHNQEGIPERYIDNIIAQAMTLKAYYKELYK